MKTDEPYSLDLDKEQLQFLQDLATTHHLPDVGKAVRCLVNYARENPAKHAEIFTEVRCVNC